MTPRKAKCAECRRDFNTPRAAYNHWLRYHSAQKLGLGERSVLADIQATRVLPREQVD